jgi:membrane protein YdbS with pleckstrin-like domain
MIGKEQNKMNDEELLKNEKLEKMLSPHPLSFMRYQALCIFLIIWGVVLYWFVNISEWYSLFTDLYIYTLILWAIILLIVGVIVSITTIRWRIFFIYLGIVVVGLLLMFWQGWQNSVNLFIPIYTILISFIGFLLVELYRRSHKYLLSNERIIFKGGVITKEERTLRYDKITDINAKQGILGQIFGFGTIIPISQSGFGLGSDNSFAAGGIQLGEKKAKFLGIFGGGKEVQTPRARSYYELHGVHPFKEIKQLVEEYIQEKDTIPYHQKNIEYQKEQTSFQKEQIDIQKQMRDLLKMQNGSKKNFEKKINDEDI